MGQFPFRRLQAALADLIASLPAESRLPSEPDLAKQLGVSRATLREAMRMFETQGLIRRRQGAGTFVVGQPPVIESGLEVLEELKKLRPKMPVVIISALDDPESRKKAADAGASAYYTKPFSPIRKPES